MPKKPFVIAIDGPAASGKGTLGRRLAEHYGLAYLDTGSLYRLVGAKALEYNKKIISIAESGALEALQKIITIAQQCKLEEIADYKLAGEEVGYAASVVSAIPEVRKALLEFQRRVANSEAGAVLDGRDIGTVVCPDANFKLFLTASIEARARRRFKQLQSSENQAIEAAVREELLKRDERDMKRAISPLVPADDALRIDTTDMEMEEVFKKVVAMIDSKKKK